MRILMTGCTGFIGQNLAELLLKSGHDLVVLTRSTKGFKSRFSLPTHNFEWPGYGPVPADALNEVDAVIHLAGEPVAKARWSEEVKRAIYDSRITGTKDLIDSLKTHNVEPKVFISASAIGYYGAHGDMELNEAQPAGDDFLAEVCRDWEEQVATGFMGSQTRAVYVRTGIVLGHGGGALAELEPLARNGVLGPLGSGKQWMSWIHIDDLVALFDFALSNESVEGPINAVAPQPERNKDLTMKLNRHLKQWTMPPVPGFVIKVLKGEMATILMASQKVLPQKALELGFTFKFENLESAFEDLFPEPGSELLVVKQWLPQAPAELFPFFADEKNLEKITPGFLGFSVVGKSTEAVEEGTLIDYKLKIHGFPAKWRSLISNWQPNHQFVDEQIKGPYSRWHHTHSFEPLKGGTLCTDEVLYRVPMGLFGRLTAGGLVRKDVEQIFSFRRKKLNELFGSTQ